MGTHNQPSPAPGASWWHRPAPSHWSYPRAHRGTPPALAEDLPFHSLGRQEGPLGEKTLAEECSTFPRKNLLVFLVLPHLVYLLYLLACSGLSQQLHPGFAGG